MRFIKFLLILVLFLFCLLFFTQNKEALNVGLPLKMDLFVGGLNWEGQAVPYYFVALGCLAVGMLFASLFFLVDRIKLTYTILEKKHKIARFEGDIKRLNGQLEDALSEVEKARQVAEKATTAAEAEVEKRIEAAKKAAEETAEQKMAALRKELTSSEAAPSAVGEKSHGFSLFGKFKKAVEPTVVEEVSELDVAPTPKQEEKKKFFSFGKNS